MNFASLLTSRRNLRILLIGTSFPTQMIQVLACFKVSNDLDYFYYFKSHEIYPGGTKAPFNPATLDWEKILLERAGFGFVEAALQHLH